MSKAMQLKARIKNLATMNHIPAQAVLQNFMLERLLERISISKYKDMVILKGGMLIASLVGVSSRTTMDMDATLRGYPLSEETLRQAIGEICDIPIDDDVTLTFDHIVPIRDDDEYGGYRVSILARYESIHVPLKIDITTGDILTPDAVHYCFHSNFEDKQFEIWAYNIETILAEKIETILRRSVLNTRPRDFYDVYIITKIFWQAIDSAVFLRALRATSEKRGSFTALADQENILIRIQADTTMRQRWERYHREYHYANEIGFDDVTGALSTILNV
jgi:predicted nucleotidyltransferase component of viral defense system